MMDTAENLAQVAGEPLDSSDQTQGSEPIPPWKRQPGEPLLWFRRFKLYLDCGYKRSLVAALQKERAKLQVLESTDTSEKPAASKSASNKRAKGGTKVEHLQEVPKPKPVVQVPGSWKQASIKWRWVERAAAWDEHILDKAVDDVLEDFMDGPASSFNRVRTLRTMLDALAKIWNGNHMQMTYEQDCMYVARMQSIMRDIREEMRHFDEAVARAILRRTAERSYKGADMEKWEARLLTMSKQERAEMSKAIDREQARRHGQFNS